MLKIMGKKIIYNCMLNFFLSKPVYTGLQIRVRTRKLFFLFLNQNICCGYSKEPSQWDGSFEHPKHMLEIIGKKIFAILRWNFCCVFTGMLVCVCTIFPTGEEGITSHFSGIQEYASCSLILSTCSATKRWNREKLTKIFTLRMIKLALEW